MRTLCGCQWIDSRGLPTPDANPPIGIALLRSVGRDGRATYGGGFPICAVHAARAPVRHFSWPGTEHQTITDWTIEPFAP